MQLSDLTYHTETSGGITVHAADYNSNFKIWTADYETYYLLDRAANDVTSVSKTQLQNWIDDGLLEPDADTNTSTDNGITNFFTGNSDLIKYGFLIAAAFMVIYLAKQ